MTCQPHKIATKVIGEQLCLECNLTLSEILKNERDKGAAEVLSDLIDYIGKK